MRQLLLVLVLCCLPVLGGCGASASRVQYYVLASPVDDLSMGDQAAQLGPRVGINPIVLPAYLERSQIVLRQGNSVDITREEYHRWGEDLDAGIARVLSVAMTNSLQLVHGLAVPLRMGTPVDYRAQVEIRRFEGQLGGQVYLEAVWTLQKDGVALREGQFLAQDAAGSSISSLVQAQSRLVEQLGHTMGEALRRELNT